MPVPNLPEAAFAENLAALFAWLRKDFFPLVAARSKVAIDGSSIQLMAVLDTMGPCRASDLATVLGLDRSTVSRHIERTIRRGWVVRESDARDGRAALLSLTESGQLLRERMLREWVRIVADAVEGWDTAHIESLAQMTARLSKSLVAEERRMGVGR